jgi:toxin-antitoxin system PIN domain toxin
MTFLLDINILAALFDSSHVNHDAAHEWFGRAGSLSWATCPITENSFIRVLSSPSYPSVQATPNDIMERLARFCALPGHVFWPDDISLTASLDADSRARLQGCQQLTDFYLAALAAHKGGKLATFDGSFARSVNGTPLGRALQLLR